MGRRKGRTVGPTKFQVLATKGVPTFLLLEGGGSPARPDAEGEALGAAAQEIYDRIPPSARHAWPGGTAAALGKLAEDSFFPPAAPADSGLRDGEPYRAFAEGRYIRAVNFHATPTRLAGSLEKLLSQLAESFVSVSYGDLANLVENGAWPYDKPGVVLNFFDGFRDNFNVVVPILDRLDLTGWFFVVSDWILTPPEDQRRFAADHLIDIYFHETDLPADGRIAFSPEEVRDLAERGHVIASHTQTHATASLGPTPGLPSEALRREVAASKRDLERISGQPVGALAWLEGTALGTNAEADEALAEEGYRFLFANHAVQRVP